MDTLHIVGCIVSLAMLYILAVLCSADKTRSTGLHIMGLLSAHAAGLDAYCEAWRAARKYTLQQAKELDRRRQLVRNAERTLQQPEVTQ